MSIVKPLSGAATDVLHCLFFHGPTWDGNMPSKSGRGELCDAGYVVHLDGWASLTEEGLKLALAAGLDRKKDTWQRQRSQISRRQHRAFVALAMAQRFFIAPPDDGGHQDWMPEFMDRFDHAVRNYVLGQQEPEA